MKYAGLILGSLWRKPKRTTLTIASLSVAFVLFGLLQPINTALKAEDITGDRRILVVPRYSIQDYLSISQIQQIEIIPGVEMVSHSTWFGGVYKDPKNKFERFAVAPEELFALWPEIELPLEQREAFINTRTGVIIGRKTAEKYAIKPGDRIPIMPEIWYSKNADQWEFDVVGIFNDGGSRVIKSSSMYLHYNYLDENRTWGDSLVSTIEVSVNDAKDIDEIVKKIDDLFINSDRPTRSSSMQAAMASSNSSLGDLSLILNSTLLAVFFTILFVSGNTMSQSIRERTSEIAILKTLGFQNQSIFLVVLVESIVMSMVGALIGLLGAIILIRFSELIVPVDNISVGSHVVLSGMAWAMALGVSVALLPAIRAKNLNIVDSFRG